MNISEEWAFVSASRIRVLPSVPRDSRAVRNTESGYTALNKQIKVDQVFQWKTLVCCQRRADDTAFPIN